MRRLPFGLCLVALAATVVVGAGVAAKPPPSPKVDVCHVDRDGVVHLKTIAANTLAAHLAHADALPGVMALPAGTTFSASNSWVELGATPDMAFDGTGNGWNSRNWPVQWIEVNFGSPQPFSKMTAWVAQTPAGYTNHDVTLERHPRLQLVG